MITTTIMLVIVQRLCFDIRWRSTIEGKHTGLASTALSGSFEIDWKDIGSEGYSLLSIKLIFDKLDIGT